MTHLDRDQSAHRYSGRVLALLPLALAVALLSPGCARKETWPGLYSYSVGDLEEALECAGYEKFVVLDARRHGDGRGIFVEGHYGGQPTAVSLRLDGTATTLSLPGAVWYASDGGEFLGWTDDLREGLRLRDGTLIMPSSDAAVRIDPTGTVFCVGTGAGHSEVGFVDRPSVRTTVVGFRCTRLFWDAGRAYLFESGTTEVRYKVLEVVEGGPWKESGGVIGRTRRAPSPFTVLDMDPRAGVVLLCDTRDLCPSRLFVYTLVDQALRPVGWEQRASFFLAGDVVQAVRRSCG